MIYYFCFAALEHFSTVTSKTSMIQFHLFERSDTQAGGHAVHLGEPCGIQRSVEHAPHLQISDGSRLPV